jgi:hypothetical protein
MIDITIESYLEGIHRGHDEGLIQYAPYYVPEGGIMTFSNHVPWEINGVKYKGELSLTNTRSLADVVEPALHFFGDSTIRFLELGPGAGNACYELYCLAKQRGETVQISTVSYTPINPYMPILLSGNKLLQVLWGNKYLKFMAEGPQGPLWYILTEEVFHIQNEEGTQIFGQLDEPYINHQYIGSYPENIDLGADTFDFIYDIYGPIGGKDLKPINDAYSRLSERGILFFLFDRRYALGTTIIEGAKKDSTDIFDESDSVIVDIRSDTAIIAKKGNKLSSSLKKRLLEKKLDPKKQTMSTYNMPGLLLNLQSME